MTSTIAFRCIVRLSTALALLASGSMAAHALSDRSWTTIGSAGAVAPAQQSLIEHSINWARVPAATPGANVTLRYNITATDGLFPVGPVATNFYLGMRYIDNGANAQVTARLRSYDQATGALEALALLDSNVYAQSSSAQGVSKCIPWPDFDFGQKIYFIEVTLSKTAASGRPQIGGVWLTPIGCLVSP